MCYYLRAVRNIQFQTQEPYKTPKPNKTLRKHPDFSKVSVLVPRSLLSFPYKW